MPSDAEAFVYDAVRTPRGRGQDTGSLHGVKPISLVVGLIDALRERNPGLDPAAIDDIVLGVVSPVGEQGGDMPGPPALAGRAARPRRRRAAQPVLRLRPGGGEHRRAEGPLRLGAPGPGRRRRVDVAGADGLRRRRLGHGPGDRAAPPGSCRRASAPT